MNSIQNFWKNLNLPNKLTVIRLLLVIPFILFLSIALILNNLNNKISFGSWYIPRVANTFRIIFLCLALLIFIAAMITDFFDGKIARERKIVTDFGKLWDPIADKIMTTTALIFLTVVGYLSFPLLLLIILRDIIVAGARGVMIKHNISVAADKYGKIKTVILTAVIISGFLFHIIFSSVSFSLIDSVLFSSIENINVININAILENISYYFLNGVFAVAAILSTISGIKYVSKVSTYMFK
ncbi:CDP-diacylglycerol--glycerol-3-phosphate 3-phosphatidyltransferase [Mycoplasmopsis pullorum]|uniref:CDP-diacylglycerol--glycerol-3-phosphate 3-phosphatidyltransferase n=1 Tax=Mycoplasmopsis pullorum TaxID=48003 RepID=A0A1L4FSP7_9BACT|nr:CDP-diacylglycerol--glycerol-3-phosphate 3-phosphatidyltransferase [Mycoplasmopsis pullorum]APJ38619.1 CDP-diacylglycerol--glycerol-3-phosphate 3-phosphatidyltransferase [Mycoplasmopsis pullorum]